MNINGPSKKLNLNVPGMGGGLNHTRRSSGVSSQATRNLGRSTSAGPSSHFQLNGRRSTGFVAGEFTTKGSNRYNYNRQRAYFNSRGATSTREYTPSYGMNMNSSIMMPNMYAPQSNSSTNFLNSMGIGMQIGKEAFNFLNNIGVIKMNNGDNNVSNSNVLTRAMDALTGSSGGGGSEISGAISKMENCNDSASLRGAIAEANGQLYNMEGMTSILQADADKATTGKETFENNYDDAEKGVKTAQNQLGIADQNVKGAKAGRDNALNEVSKADSKYGEAVKTYTEAHDAHIEAKTNYTSAQNATARAEAGLKSAEATLASTPEYITDGNGNRIKNDPAHAQAEAAVKEAEQQLQQAKQEEDKAKSAMEAAAQKETNAAKAKQEAYDNLGDKKAAVDTAEKQLKTQQDRLDTAKTNQGKAADNLVNAQDKLSTATQILNSAESAIEKFKVHQKNVTKLKEAINKQNRRLGELEQREQKQYDKYDEKAQRGIDKNNARQQNIDGDVDTRGERRTVRSMDRTNDRVEANLQRRNSYAGNVSDSQWIKETLMKQTPTVISGEQYRTGTTPSGQTVFYRGNMPISEEEYNKAVQGAGL